MSGAVRGIARLDPYQMRWHGMGYRDRPRTASQLRREGSTAEELHADGFRPQELAAAGIDARALKDLGVDTASIAALRGPYRGHRFRASDCRSAGCSVLECLGAMYSIQELVAAGFTSDEFERAGVAPQALRSIGFTTTRTRPRVARDVTL